VVILLSEKGRSVWRSGITPGWAGNARGRARPFHLHDLALRYSSTAGFFGKYFLFRSAVQHGFGSLVVIAVLNSALSVYYYLRVLVALYMRPLFARRLSPLTSGGAVVTVCALATLWIGFAPTPGCRGASLLGLVRESVLNLR